METNNSQSLNKVATLEGKDIYHKITDPYKNSRTLIMIHGLVASSELFNNVLPALSENFRVISYDMRGHSKTKKLENSTYSLDEHANDLKALMDHLKIDQAYIIGHSLGGRVALQFLKLFPEMVVKAIIYDQNIRPHPSIQIDSLSKQFEAFKTKNTIYDSQEELNEALTECGLPDFYREKYNKTEDGKLIVDWDPDVALKCLEGVKLDLTETVQEIKCPMLFLKSDLEETPEAFKKLAQAFWNGEFEYVEKLRLENVKVQRIEGSGHLIHWTHPDAFVKAVVDYCN